jgi:glycosyltransferase involved in cell wall biosynthesis
MSDDKSDSISTDATVRLPVYLLITPARNEAQFIESTIQSVVEQTVRPLKWVIVSDGSTDGTEAIVRRYAADHPWIELMRMPDRCQRNFGGKAHAVNAAYASVRSLDFQVVVNLDADITVSGNHFAYLLSKLAADPALGIVGTPFREVSGETYDYRFVSTEHVSGACQVFRRQCFEDINGYTPLAAGGVDHLAVITARMKGWKTRTFMDTMCLHSRKEGTAQYGGTLKALFRIGVKDYSLGGHPLWELSRVFYRIPRRPFVVGGLALGSGYFWATVSRVERPISPEVLTFHRREQMRRLKKFFGLKSVLGNDSLQRPA